MPTQAASTPLAEKPAARATALLVIDMISDWSFPDAEPLLARAVRIAPAIAALKARCTAEGIPTVYINDNQGRWRSEFHAIVQSALAGQGLGSDICRMLSPAPEDYSILKPKHSGFYETPLNLLLQHLRVERVILTGVAAESCVLMTASDAHLRDYQVLCPRDCIASSENARHRHALRHFEAVLGMDTTSSTASGALFAANMPSTRKRDQP